jgi:pimeloyl-ACP methyl ester carboxylesterase
MSTRRVFCRRYRLTEMPDVLELAPQISRPTLFIRGGQEDPENYPAERFRDRAGGTCDVEIVPDCGHFYVGREEAICDLVAGSPARSGLSDAP